MNEQSVNLYENKGSVFHRRPQSGNVIENKDSYALKAGMLLKTQHVRFLPPNSVQVGAHVLAGSPFSTFDSQPSTASGGKRGGGAVAVSPEAPAEPVPCSLFPIPRFGGFT